MSPPSEPRELFGTERLLAFSDGVFAVAITLLVLDLRLPETGPQGGALVWASLLDMRPKLLIFAFTFVVVGMSWIGHHRKFSYVRKVDTGLLWLNLFYRLALCLVPFATSVFSVHGERVGFTLYAVVMVLVSLLSAAVSSYAMRAPFLIDPGPPAAVRRDMILSPLCNAAIFLGSATLAAAGWESVALWCLLLMAPASVFFGSRRVAAA